MALYIKNQQVPAWKEYLAVGSAEIANGAYSDPIDLPSTGGYYGHFFVMWNFDSGTNWPWKNNINGDGYGFGIIQGTHSSQDYTFRSIYTNESAVACSSSKFNIQNNTGGDYRLNCRVMAWTFNPDDSDG